ncbi:hypothetical protein SLEP1_g50857 [Rubroshorea leprosula]|uniref:Uncharacterized protein n=1 Tax=Rubroshorea leprosula TaxID=152421 RepID=A0AAV5M3G6_9ROSI|nr:hypothetical protein SLEP1_g50857 [Rubroshorea leprosula]
MVDNIFDFLLKLASATSPLLDQFDSISLASITISAIVLGG